MYFEFSHLMIYVSFNTITLNISWKKRARNEWKTHTL